MRRSPFTSALATACTWWSARARCGSSRTGCGCPSPSSTSVTRSGVGATTASWASPCTRTSRPTATSTCSTSSTPTTCSRAATPPTATTPPRTSTSTPRSAGSPAIPPTLPTTGRRSSPKAASCSWARRRARASPSCTSRTARAPSSSAWTAPSWASPATGPATSTTDQGSDADTYFQHGLDYGIIGADQNIGALRSQYLGSLSGKLVRLDPETGDGLPSNPFWDPANPRSVRSRTWALGLRNPYRFSLKPGSGSHNPDDANPGSFFVGDVGWSSSEDFHVIDRPGLNLGWPIFEGMVPRYPGNVPNLAAPNPLYGIGGCTQQFLNFVDLVKQESNNPVSFPNPCNASVPIPDSWTDGGGQTWRYFKFEHTRPPIAWRGQRPGRDLRRERGGHHVPGGGQRLQGPGRAVQREHLDRRGLLYRRRLPRLLQEHLFPRGLRGPVDQELQAGRGTERGTAWMGSSPASPWYS